MKLLDDLEFSCKSEETLSEDACVSNLCKKMDDIDNRVRKNIDGANSRMNDQTNFLSKRDFP